MSNFTIQIRGANKEVITSFDTDYYSIQNPIKNAESTRILFKVIAKEKIGTEKLLEQAHASGFVEGCRHCEAEISLLQDRIKQMENK